MLDDFLLLEATEQMKRFDSIEEWLDLPDVENMSDFEVSKDAYASQSTASEAERRDLL